MGVIRQTGLLGGSGPKNWFGDGSDGDIRITSAGAEQSFTSGVTWQAIPGWTIIGNVIMVPSIQDGDMVVVNAITFTVESGYTFTTANRCRGLQIYTLGDCTINGEISMTARGCWANPADAVVTSNTPVAPSDGHAVPEEGIILRRFAAGYDDIHTAATLMEGCGQSSVDSEANQPEVDGNGVVIAIPLVGGPGGPGYACTVGAMPGNNGGSAVDGSGGGGSGCSLGSGGSQGGWIGGGTAGTCFSGGVGGGAGRGNTSGTDGAPYAGVGGTSADSQCGGGVGNPGGPYFQVPGTGGLLIVVCRGVLTVSGTISSNGVGSSSAYRTGGASGAGIVVLLAVVWSVSGTVSASCGKGALTTDSSILAGDGGDGSVLGPITIRK